MQFEVPHHRSLSEFFLGTNYPNYIFNFHVNRIKLLCELRKSCKLVTFPEVQVYKSILILKESSVCISRVQNHLVEFRVQLYLESGWSSNWKLCSDT